MRKILFLLLSTCLPATILADNGTLKNETDSLSYAIGITYGNGTLNDASFQPYALDTDPNQLDAFLQGTRQQLSTLNQPQGQAFGIGAMLAVFISDAVASNPNAFSIKDLIQGLNDGAADSHSLMDTQQAMALLRDYKTPGATEKIKNKELFKKASYAYGLLRMTPQAFEAAMDAYNVPQAERDIRQYAMGYESVLSLSMTADDAFSLGTQIGCTIRMAFEDLPAKGVSLSTDCLQLGLTHGITTKNMLMSLKEADRYVTAFRQRLNAK